MPTVEGDDSYPALPHGNDVFFEDAYRGLADLLRDIAVRKFEVPFHDAESLVNEVFTAFLLRAPSIRDPKKWLVGALCHASRAYLRIAAHTEQMPPDIEGQADPDMEELEQRIVNNVTIAVALSKLNPKCRATLRMFYFEGYSTIEIAKELKTSVGYVTQLLHQCRRRAREIYKELGRETF